MSKWTEFRNESLHLIGNLAPGIATALGGPFVGAATQKLSEALLGKSNGTVQEIEEKLAIASPEALVALKKADQEFLEKMEELGIRREELEFKDKDSARNREIQTGDKTPARLAFVVTVGFFGILGYLMKYGVPTQGGEALLIMLGSLGTAWTGIIGYYFGSSAGSKAKTETITKLSNGVK